MQKQLSVLLSALKAADTGYEINAGGKNAPCIDTAVSSLVFDSREVKEGSLFFALPGTHTNGGRFIPNAIENGASAVVYQGDLDTSGMQTKYPAVAFIRVDDARKSMAPIADCFFNEPSRRLIVIGVTGTEGKSSTVSFIWQSLRLIGEKAGFISTVQYSTGGEAIANPEHQTTPESPIVQERLYEMAEAGCRYAVIESSSHALSIRNNRLGCVRFDCAVFMNVTLEHLEFHGTFEQYRDDKANLFRMLDMHDHFKTINGEKVLAPCFGIVNALDKSAPYFAQATKHPVLSFMTEIDGKNASLIASDVHSDEKEVSFTLSSKSAVLSSPIKVTAPVPGAFNALNIMACALAVAVVTGKAEDSALLNNLQGRLERILDKCAFLSPVKGRMEHVEAGQPFEVIIDYAHTPSSFEMLLPPIKKRCKGQLIAVFGSGGERDKVKRPLQGEIAAKYCDKIILTNEDPRKEDEMQILNEIARGVLKETASKNAFSIGKNLFLIPDRKSAIHFAFNEAKDCDIVLLLGKGHENSIIGKDGPAPYDEATAAIEAARAIYPHIDTL